MQDLALPLTFPLCLVLANSFAARRSMCSCLAVCLYSCNSSSLSRLARCDVDSHPATDAHLQGVGISLELPLLLIPRNLLCPLRLSIRICRVHLQGQGWHLRVVPWQWEQGIERTAPLVRADSVPSSSSAAEQVCSNQRGRHIILLCPLPHSLSRVTFAHLCCT